jgi:hypothetical protein
VTPLRIWKKDAQECSTGFAALSQLKSNSIFSGIILQTGANGSSTMRIEQYRDYCRHFAAHVNIQPVCRAKSIKGIGVHQRIIWTATVSILFTDLEIVIDVSFVLIDGNTATLLSLRDYKKTNLISAWYRITFFSKERQRLSIDLIFADEQQPGPSVSKRLFDRKRFDLIISWRKMSCIWLQNQFCIFYVRPRISRQHHF